MTSSDKVKATRTETGRRTPRNPSRILANHAVEAILSKKGQDIVVMDMREVTGVADYFVLCTADSDIQLRAIADAVREQIKEKVEERPWHVEGYDHLTWVLLDYVDVVVHVFDKERRAFYDLERLWGDAPTEQIEDDGSPVRMLQA